MEGFLRWYQPDPFVKTARELWWMRDNPGYNVFTVDPDFGFRPIFGNGLYNEYGTKANNYSLEKPDGVTRLLFIGDSVTHRAKIIDSLQEIYGDEEFEYWNAGVESYGTVQEVAYYKKYNAAIKPDHVILTFHINDFETTPIAFPNDGDGLIVYAPNQPLSAMNPWLFRNSYLYRFVINRIGDSSQNQEKIIQEAEASLLELRDILAADNIRFSVLVLPMFLPYEQWQPHEQTGRDRILQTLTNANIIHYDLFPISKQAIKDGITIEEEPGSHWHPSKDVSVRFAEYLFAEGLLE